MQNNTSKIRMLRQAEKNDVLEPKKKETLSLNMQYGFQHLYLISGVGEQQNFWSKLHAISLSIGLLQRALRCTGMESLASKDF